MELALYKRVARIEDLVDVETSADDAEKSKPHPDIFEAAVSRLGITSADIVVVGDTPYDAEAAEGAGLRTVGLLCGGFAEADLRKAGCIAIYRDPADLLAHYDKSPRFSRRANPQERSLTGTIVRTPESRALDRVAARVSVPAEFGARNEMRFFIPVIIGCWPRAPVRSYRHRTVPTSGMTGATGWCR